MPDRILHKHDPPESSSASTAGFPVEPTDISSQYSFFSSYIQSLVSSKDITTDYRINVPHNDCGVFGTSRQFCAIIGKFAEPDFIAMFSENLLSVAWELFSTDEEHTNKTDKMMFPNTIICFLPLFASLKLLKCYSHSSYKSCISAHELFISCCMWVLPAAGVVQQQGHRIQSSVQLSVVVEAALPLQLHCLFQQSLQAARRQHHRRRQVCWGGTHTRAIYRYYHYTYSKEYMSVKLSESLVMATRLLSFCRDMIFLGMDEGGA